MYVQKSQVCKKTSWCIMVHHTLQNKARQSLRITGMWEAGQTQTLIARQIGVNQSQVQGKPVKDL